MIKPTPQNRGRLGRPSPNIARIAGYNNEDRHQHSVGATPQSNKASALKNLIIQGSEYKKLQAEQATPQNLVAA